MLDLMPHPQRPPIIYAVLCPAVDFEMTYGSDMELKLLAVIVRGRTVAAEAILRKTSVKTPQHEQGVGTSVRILAGNSSNICRSTGMLIRQPWLD